MSDPVRIIVGDVRDGLRIPLADGFRLIGSNFVQPDRRDAMVEAMATRRGGAP